VSLVATARGKVIRGESAICAARTRIGSLSFDPFRPRVPSAAISAITAADWVLLGPGSLFTSVLATSALPGIRAALASTRARMLWICNLEPERYETSGMSAIDHLAALRSHGVRVDAVLYDPAARLRFAPGQLATERLEAVPRPLASLQPGRHDPVLLSAALRDLFCE
jgi:uncharacterized cofD-like protein